MQGLNNTGFQEATDKWGHLVVSSGYYPQQAKVSELLSGGAQAWECKANTMTLHAELPELQIAFS